MFPKGEENYFDHFIDKFVVDLEAEFIQQKVHEGNKGFLCGFGLFFDFLMLPDGLCQDILERRKQHDILKRVTDKGNTPEYLFWLHH